MERTFRAPRGLGRTLKKEFERVALPEISRLYATASYLTKDRAEAEDLVQETLLRAFRFFDKFQPGTNCGRWLLSILRNLFFNRYKQRKREPETVDWERMDHPSDFMAIHKENADPESLFVFRSLGEEVANALKELPREYRKAIMSVAIEQSTYKEAAQAIGCPVGTVRSRVSRATRLLRTSLRDCALRRGFIDPCREARAVN